MRQILAILIIAAFLWGAKRLFDHYEQIQRRQSRFYQEPAATNVVPTELPGFMAGYESQLEATLVEARKRGATGLKTWLAQYRLYVSDPRLAAIELDYVVLLGPANRNEARRVLGEIRKRLPPSSPVYARFQQLEKTYQ